MSTLTWITEKEQERDFKKQQRRPISVEEKLENFIAAVRNASCHKGENER